MAEKAEKYVCTRNWARNKVGDVVARYLYNKYPVEVQEGNFKPLVETKVAAKPAVAPSKFVAEVTPAK